MFLKDCLVQLKMQAIPAMPESLCIVEMGASDGGSSDEPGMNSLSMLYLNIGLQNGVLLRTVLDGVTGEMADTRARYLGGKPVKLFKIRTRGNEAVSIFKIICHKYYFSCYLCILFI